MTWKVSQRVEHSNLPHCTLQGRFEAVALQQIKGRVITFETEPFRGGRAAALVELQDSTDLRVLLCRDPPPVLAGIAIPVIVGERFLEPWDVQTIPLVEGNQISTRAITHKTRM